MTDALMHRGPDGEGHWINESVTAGLGHRRLSIIDLSANGAQPMHYRNRYSIVHNGEIYNYLELKKELAAKGYVFASETDTEVIIAAYDYWKESCLQYFDGMFAFAIWDAKELKLFAARDRFGEKPFYYWNDGEQLLFASEVKALWAAGAEKHPNEKLLFNFITLGYTQNPANASETAYNKIYKLPAASYFICGTNNLKTIEPIKYWQLDTNLINTEITEQNAINKFKELFLQSIKKRLRSDVPFGTSLSGGLDSSSIAAIIQQIQSPGSSLKTFSAIFPGAPSDESAYIKLLVDEKRIENFSVQPTAEAFVNDFEKLCYHQEGLMASASVYAQYNVFELAHQQNIKVLLDGQGADETLAGYQKYYHWYWQELYKNNKPLLKNEMAAARSLDIREAWTWKNKLTASFPSYAGNYLKKAKEKKQQQSADLEKNFISSYGKSYYELPQQDCLSNVLYYNTIKNGLEELLHYADRNSMAHGREVRLPFLNHELVEFVFSLPAHFKIKNGRTKWVLRKSVEEILPPEIAWRKDKIGFEPPQKEWMHNKIIREYIQEGKRKLVQKGILQAQVLNKKIQPQDSHAADNFDWRYLVTSRLF